MISLVGCAEGPVKPDPAVIAEQRERFLLEIEPADAVTPLDWRDAQSEEPADDGTPELAPRETPAAESEQIVLVGQVGGMPNPWGSEAEPHFPWRQGEATFFLVDPATAAEFASHADDQGEAHAADCPFCAREAASKTNAIAVVSFADAKEPGTPAPVNAQDLFDLKVGDLVVVRGKWSLTGDLLMVEADGLFRR